MCRFNNLNKEGNPVRCGKCDQCFKDRAMDWYVRIYYDLKRAKSAYFVTLTYDDSLLNYTIDGKPTLLKQDLQRYFKRLRKREGNNKISYYASSEYGGRKGRPHYHAIIFNIKNERNLTLAWSKTMSKKQKPVYYGSVFIPPYGGVADASIKYVTGYIGKKKPKKWLKGRLPEFSLCSQKIGLSFVDQLGKQFISKQWGHTVIGKTTFPLPRYIKQKLYPDKIIESSTDAWKRYLLSLYARGLDHGQIKAIMKHIPLKSFKPVKEKNPLLLTISKQNHEKFIETKMAQIKDFYSEFDWHKNRFEVAKSYNSGITRN